MARQVLPIVGGVVGSFFGAPQLGYLIGSIVGNVVDPVVIKGPSLGDGQQTTTQEGAPRSIVYGLGVVGGNIIDRGPLIKKKKKSGGKGGPVTVTEEFYLTFAIRICEGPIDEVLRIWEDDKLVYDIRPESKIKKETKKYKKTFKLYKGDETQLPDPSLESIHGAGNTCAYRGTAYIVYANKNTTERRGSIPSYRFEVTKESIQYESNLPMIFQGSETYLNDNTTIGPNVDWPDFLPPDGINPGSTYPVPGTFTISNDAKYVARVFSRFVNDGFSGLKPADSGGIAQVLYINDTFTEYNQNIDLAIPSSSNVIWTAFTNDNNILAVATNDPPSDLLLTNSSTVRIYSLYQNSATIIDTVRFTGLINSIAWSPDDERLVVCQGPDGFTVLNVFNGVVTSQVLQSTVESALYAGWHPTENRLATIDTFAEPKIFDYIVAAGAPVYSKSATATSPPASPYGNRAAFVSFIGQDGNKLILSRNNLAASSSRPVFFTYDADLKTFSTYSYTSDPYGYYGELRVSSDFTKYIYCKYTGPGSSSVNRKVRDENDTESFNLLTSIPSGSTAITSYRPQAIVREAKTVSLSDVLRNICFRSDVDPLLLDTNQIDLINLRGLVVSGDYTGAQVIRTLQQPHFFDVGEWDGKINTVLRGGPAIAAIDYSELTSEPESDETKRESAIEYPRKIELSYQNPAINYEPAKAFSERTSPEVNVSGVQSIEVPFILNETEAAQIAEKLHKVSWAEAEGEVVINVSDEFDYLTTSDVIALYTRGRVRRLRIEKIDRADGINKLTCRVDRQTAYISSATALPMPDVPAGLGGIEGPTLFFAMNLPALTDNTDFLHYHYAASGLSSGWYGASLLRSEYDGEFNTILSEVNQSIIGKVQNEIMAASEHYPDTTNKIIIKLYDEDDELESFTDEQLLREKGAFTILRDDGTGEVMQYRDALNLGGGYWELSYLLRGRLNSGASSHLAGSNFVLLDTSSIITAGSALIGADIDHKAVSYGQSTDEVSSNPFNWDIALSQYEFPIDFLTVLRDNEDVQVSFSARHRFGTDIIPVKSVNFDGFRVEFTDGVNNKIVYTNDEFVNETLTGFTFPASVSVIPLNRITGDGPITTKAII